MAITTTDPGGYDEDELATSIVRGRLDVGLLRARAWCDDTQAMCMYADWLLHRALAPEGDEDRDELVVEARSWLRRATASGSRRATGMLGDVMLEYGGEFGDDRRAGAQLLRGAAFGGDVAAMRRLGVRCLTQEPGASGGDVTEARRWLMRAAARGDERSAELLEQLGAGAATQAGSDGHH